MVQLRDTKNKPILSSYFPVVIVYDIYYIWKFHSTQLLFLTFHTAVVSHIPHSCCFPHSTQLLFLPFHTAAVSHIPCSCCFSHSTQLLFLTFHTAVVSHIPHSCCFSHSTQLLFLTFHTAAVSQSLTCAKCLLMNRH